MEKRTIHTIGIVSLSSGILGESFVRHELDIGRKRMEEYGVRVKFTEHALSGIDYVKDHPEERAADLIAAFQDEEVDAIVCSIGGDDTYRLLPYLFDHEELKNAVTDKPFLGFSDTTYNHFMLHKLGLKTFYGQAFLCDMCEPGKDMLPYTRQYFEEFLRTGTIHAVTPSPVWYLSREDFGPEQIGKELSPMVNPGWELLQGPKVFSGKLLGGCIDSMYDMFVPDRYADCPVLCERYGLFPKAEEWKNTILLLESSEEKMSPERYRDALVKLKEAGVFENVTGVLVGMPMDRAFEAEYKRELLDVIDDPRLPILCNISIGHGLPRCILPFGVEAHVDSERQIILFDNE